MTSPALELIGMHGWAGDSRAWQPWQQAAGRRGWLWHCGEQGYGPLPPCRPAWSAAGGPRAVIVHSLGLHLLPESVIAAADAVVLLASFGRFIPAGRAGRRWHQSLLGMAARLDQGEAGALLQDFLAEAAAPDPADLLPAGPGSEPITTEGVKRLRRDLALLEHCDGLPALFPPLARTLIVEAGEDRIVAPQSRLLLRQALPAADVWLQADAGHSLLRADLVEPVLDWLERR